jgi:hypothetical protein
MNERLLKTQVERLYQQPSTTIGHAEPMRRPRDRAARTDAFKQRELAGPQYVSVALSQPDAQGKYTGRFMHSASRPASH